MNNKKVRISLFGIGILILLAIFIIIALTGKKKEEKIKIGFIMSGSCQEDGWNGMHYKGVKYACDELGLDLLVKENVKEFTGQCKDAIEELAEDGAQMIILSSYGYSEEVKDLVKNYPNIVFNANSFEYHESNLTSYFVRMYQVRYLSGIIAGMRTKSDVVGYVAAMPNNEVNRGISAFTLGVRQANPDAKVVVYWTGNWDDKNKETEAVNALIREKGVDVLTYHQNQGNVISAAEKAGVDSIGYHQAFTGYSDHYLTSVVCKWEVMYQEMLQEFLQGRGNAVDNFWIGIERDVVELSVYSDSVSKEISEAVDVELEKIRGGKDVFSGVIYDSEGNIRCNENEVISDEMLLEQFDWYVKGVEFYEEFVE